MLKFEDLKFEPHEVAKALGTDGVMAEAHFQNGYGVSVVRTQFTYGGREGLYELAVLRGDYITTDTPVTSGVLGWLNEQDVTAHMEQVQLLPAVAVT